MESEEKKEDKLAYTVRSTEKTRKSGADMETKALLYLMNFHSNKDENDCFIIDFLNDVTGTNHTVSKLHDIQSKGSKSNSPRQIGAELVTLFKNYISTFNFDSYVLFLGGVSNTFRVNPNKHIFYIENVTPKALETLIDGLTEECFKKRYIDNNSVNLSKIKDFLQKVLFVIDDKQSHEYIKKIIEDYPNIIPNTDILTKIFDEIKKEQSNKKITSTVEGIVLNTPTDILKYERHLWRSEILLVTLQRIINRSPLEDGIPKSYVTEYSKNVSDSGSEKANEIIEDAQRKIIEVLCNRSFTNNFWKLFSELHDIILQYPKDNLENVYSKLKKTSIKGCPNFNETSLKYFISVVKDGLT